jgi:hypothetical protein
MGEEAQSKLEVMDLARLLPCWGGQKRPFMVPEDSTSGDTAHHHPERPRVCICQTVRCQYCARVSRRCPPPRSTGASCGGAARAGPLAAGRSPPAAGPGVLTPRVTSLQRIGCCRRAAGLPGRLPAAGEPCCGPRWGRRDRCGWPGRRRAQHARAPTSSARDASALGCAPPTAIPRLGGGTRGSSARCWSRGRARSGPGPSRWWWPDPAAQQGLRPMGHAITRLRLWPGSSGPAWGAGVQRDTSSWWGTPATAPARPHGVGAHPTGTSRSSARLMGLRLCLRLPHRARPARGDARV